ncbi:hypothetical protein [Psychromonas ossibalaenae]|uniref:hypothetical protein n=1 Tax=Psychromonas ossibalaenae TaxID=444922 RepID=UPI00036E91EE|nr:hypothetical protein [Psychromonas ossibalaenae]
MLFKRIIIMLVTLLGCLLSLPGYSQQTETAASWEQWVAERHPDLDCPWLISAKNKKICNWPGEFVGRIVDDGMLFEMTVQVFSKDALVNLPGSKRNWPGALTVNKQPAASVDHNGTPRLHLQNGSNIIRGKFLWQEIPPAIALPDNIGLVKVLRGGKDLPISINNGRLILSAHQKEARLNDKNTLKIQVYRAVKDAVPISLTTIIKLFVSGKPREITIGQVSIADSRTISLHSPLPARLEEDGMLRVQVKPGIHTITVTGRFTDNRTAVSTRKVSAQWPQYEYFSFIADPRIREVKINAVKSIDTSLVDVPAQWKSYPTYRLEEGDTLLLETITRGDSASHHNSINIDRQIWLSFDGNDATVKDNISGKMHQGWRLDAADSIRLGRASVNHTPVLITRFAGSQGVEIRSPQINLQAVSSIASVKNINAVGWQTDVEQLTAVIHLPPGWRAVHAGGVDGISGTWIQKWNLWDIFWLMILIAAARKLLGVKGALLMALTLVFTFHEQQAPNTLWAILLAFIAIIGLPLGRHKLWLSRMALLPAAALVLTFIVFTISSLRLAVYPTLEKHDMHSYQVSPPVYQQNAAPAEVLMQEMDEAVIVRSKKDSRREKQVKRDIYSQSGGKAKQNLYQVGDNDRVQTGPGIPTWSWNALYINSSGTVTTEQQIHLLLSSPLLTALWRIINVVLIGFTGAVVLRRLLRAAQFKKDKPDQNAPDSGEAPLDNQPRRSEPAVLSVMLPLISGLMLVAAQSADAADRLPEENGYPPEYLLNEYETRLLKSPPCLPFCVSLDNGLLLVKDNQLSISFAISADADIAMPLPTGGETWRAEKILLDNKPTVLRKSKGVLTAFIAQGHHSFTISGAVKNEQISINLPHNIHNFRVNAPSWLIDGVRNGVVVNNSIGLTSKEVLARQDSNTLAPLPVKPYAVVHRRITLGKEWRMLTRVEKLAPTVDAASFNIALLKGEQLLSAYPVNENGTVNVQIPKNQRTISWLSALQPSESIRLTAADNPAYSETWTLIPSSIWHVKFAGIKPLKSDLNSGQLQPTWKPWPGESLDIHVKRPDGVPGEIFTTEKAALVQQSGKNVQKSTLKLKVRASQGTAYEIALAEGAKINSLLHDGRKMSINSGSRAVVQLHPGEQQIELEFERRAELSWSNSSAAVKLPGKTVNINIEYHLTRDRWLIYLNGPSLGASMLYWGVLFVILIGALVLPVIARKLQLNMPISTFGWILLGLGFSTVNSYGVLITALFFFVTALRSQFVKPASMKRWQFNFLQLSLLSLTVICVISLLVSIPIGLLSTPEMQVTGNGSYGHYFKFFQDTAADGRLPLVTVFSLPMWFYRVVMLAWSLWVATRLISWSKWWFAAYSYNGAWIAKPKKVEGGTKQQAESEENIKDA